jgi:hypothetical protein
VHYYQNKPHKRIYIYIYICDSALNSKQILVDVNRGSAAMRTANYEFEGKRVGRCVLDSSGSGKGLLEGCLNAVLNFRVQQRVGNFLKSLATNILSRHMLHELVLHKL